MLRVQKFTSIDKLERVLQGALFLAKPSGSDLFPGLVGKTIIFAQPAAATVTFTTENNQTDPTALSYPQVKAQLEAQVTGLKVGRFGDELCLFQGTPAVGGGVSITGGTGRNELGVSENSATTGKVYSSDGTTAPYVVQVYHDGQSHVLVTQE